MLVAIFFALYLSRIFILSVPDRDIAAKTPYELKNLGKSVGARKVLLHC
jgi:hypothetical protein